MPLTDALTLTAGNGISLTSNTGAGTMTISATAAASVSSLPTPDATNVGRLYYLTSVFPRVLYVSEEVSSGVYAMTPLTGVIPVDRSQLTWSAITASPWWAETAITMTGVQPGDRCSANPEADPGNVTWNAYCKTANTVTIRVASTINASTTPNTVYWKTTWEALS